VYAMALATLSNAIMLSSSSCAMCQAIENGGKFQSFF